MAGLSRKQRIVVFSGLLEDAALIMVVRTEHEATFRMELETRLRGSSGGVESRISGRADLWEGALQRIEATGPRELLLRSSLLELHRVPETVAEELAAKKREPETRVQPVRDKKEPTPAEKRSVARKKAKDEQRELEKGILKQYRMLLTLTLEIFQIGIGRKNLSTEGRELEAKIIGALEAEQRDKGKDLQEVLKS